MHHIFDLGLCLGDGHITIKRNIVTILWKQFFKLHHLIAILLLYSLLKRTVEYCISYIVS